MDTYADLQMYREHNKGVKNMENAINVFGVSKETLAFKLYSQLLEEFDVEPYSLDYGGFKALFDGVLNDYSLVLKSALID